MSSICSSAASSMWLASDAMTTQFYSIHSKAALYPAKSKNKIESGQGKTNRNEFYPHRITKIITMDYTLFWFLPSDYNSKTMFLAATEAECIALHYESALDCLSSSYFSVQQGPWCCHKPCRNLWILLLSMHYVVKKEHLSRLVIMFFFQDKVTKHSCAVYSSLHSLFCMCVYLLACYRASGCVQIP